ncbi:MAG: hypothetical protein DRQ37_02805, partial [Gammaproteobacteria bacterium]
MVCFVCLLPGLAQADLALWSDIALGRFVKAEIAAEKNIGAAGEETAANLAPLCLARSKLKRYSGLFECIDKLDVRFAAGDRTISGFFIPTSDLSPLPDLLRATAYLELNRVADAVAVAERALESARSNTGSTWGPLPPKGYQVDALMLLGIANALSGSPETAREHRAALIALDLSDTQPQKYENLRDVSVARIYMALEEYANALARMEGEHEVWVKGLSDLVLGAGDDSVSTLFELPKLLMVGTAQAATGKLELAQESLDALIAHPRIVDQGDVHWLALFERGRVAEQLGQPAQAVEFFLRAIEVIEGQRASLTTEATKIGFVGDKQQVYARLVALLVAADKPAQAFDVVERSKARALVDMLAEKQDFAVRGEKGERAKRALLELDEVQFEGRALAAPIDGASGRRSVDVLVEEIRNADPEFFSLVTVTTIPADTVRGLLGPDEALVEYYYDEDALYAFVVDSSGVRSVPLDRTGLVDAIAWLRAELQSSKGETYRQPAQQLYQRLIKPLEPELTSAKLVLVPHGALHYLPFAALRCADGLYLLDRYGLRVAPSASVLAYLRPSSQDKTGGIIAF